MDKKGFTLLEVTLFLAISGLLSLIAFAGLGPRLRNVRFTDSVRNLESNFELQVANAQGGVNRRTNISSCAYDTASNKVLISVGNVGGDKVGTGSAENCTRSGVIAIFEDAQVRYRNIVTLRNPNLNNSACVDVENGGVTAEEFMTCYVPTIVSEVDTPGLAISGYPYINGVKKTNSSDTHFAIAYVRSSDGVQTFNYYINTAAELNQSLASYGAQSNWTTPKFVCFGLDGRSAAFLFSAKSPIPQVEHGFAECSS